MKLTKKQRTVLHRFARSMSAAVVGTFAAWLAGPEAMDLVPKEYQLMVLLVVTPAVQALDKALRYGADADEQ